MRANVAAPGVSRSSQSPKQGESQVIQLVLFLLLRKNAVQTKLEWGASRVGSKEWGSGGVGRSGKRARDTCPQRCSYVGEGLDEVHAPGMQMCAQVIGPAADVIQHKLLCPSNALDGHQKTGRRDCTTRRLSGRERGGGGGVSMDKHDVAERQLPKHVQAFVSAATTEKGYGSGGQDNDGWGRDGRAPSQGHPGAGGRRMASPARCCGLALPPPRRPWTCHGLAHRGFQPATGSIHTAPQRSGRSDMTALPDLRDTHTAFALIHWWQSIPRYALPRCL